MGCQSALDVCHMSDVKLLDISEESTFFYRLPNCCRSWFDRASNRLEWGSREVIRSNFSPQMLLENWYLSSREYWPIPEQGGWHSAIFYGFLISFGRIPKVLSNIAQ